MYAHNVDIYMYIYIYIYMYDIDLYMYVCLYDFLLVVFLTTYVSLPSLGCFVHSLGVHIIYIYTCIYMHIYVYI